MNIFLKAVAVLDLFYTIHKCISMHLQPEIEINACMQRKETSNCAHPIKYWEQTWANSEDPDQTPHAASDLGLHCLPLIQQISTHQQVVKWAI